MDSKPAILFYDIASAPPVTCFAPNPWKTRYALNFKQAHYQTEWVELPEVSSVRKRLGVAANRVHRDGSPFYTLPIIRNTSTCDIVGDSFEIALYLDRLYPEGARLFPPSTVGLLSAFNSQVDAIFTQHVILCLNGMPFNPETAEESKATFAKRAGKECWDELTVRGEERARTLEGFQGALGELAKAYRRTEGPFLEGDTATYADFIVGSWLKFFKKTMEEWEELQSWHDGLWGELHRALEKYAEDK
ncbi:uncharacterized protein CDV56_109043 [Aspergillus thermomutatus]|uniref:Uncharacterized protein n=1 Tax=Aspergillus thermomutatus TaxID=41047 RepID=A0A397HU78_ASPTH|nr:uncharacterized protein CDV56_109043 [Aspergillus thermomutatus]RHZ66761.1 hypothetical protein CDV56_109043 [Aspergillus thermomutatus]